MSSSMAGRVALITGGGSGIGAAVARRFSAAGTRVAVLGRRLDVVKAIAAEVGGLAIQGDVGDLESCRSAIAQTVGQFGRLDMLVANAGVEHRNQVCCA